MRIAIRVRHFVPLDLSALELVDQVCADEKLIADCSVVISWPVPGVIKADLRANHDRISDVLCGIHRIFGVLGRDSGTLPLLVV